MKALRPSPNWILTGVIAGAALLVLHGFAPGEHWFYPRCFFKLSTGWNCPGCGGLRAMHQLLNGNPSAAFVLNPLLVIGLGIMSGIAVGSLWRRELWRRTMALLQRPRCAWTLLAVLIGFGIARNLPPFSALSP